MIAPEHAGKLLDQVVYERVLSFVDLDGLQGFELELAAALYDCGVDDDEVLRVAKEMIDNAFERLTDEPRRAVPSFDDDDCELCKAFDGEPPARAR